MIKIQRFPRHSIIRFARPSPQAWIKDMFLRGIEAEQSLLVHVDDWYQGKAKRIPPNHNIPIGEKYITIEDTIEALYNGLDIFEETISQLKNTNWKFYFYTRQPITKHYEKILKKYSNKTIEIINFTNTSKVETRALLVFANSSFNEYTNILIKSYIDLDKQVCVVNEYGVKRYPKIISSIS